MRSKVILITIFCVHRDAGADTEEEFEIDVNGLACADFGCNVGGFTDCLLQRGASSVVAIETGYGVLEWKLRNDPRVEVRERTNALHAEPPQTPIDLVVMAAMVNLLRDDWK